MARVLLDQAAGLSSEVLSAARTSGDDDGAVRTVDDAIEKVIQNDTNIDATERRAVIAARRGQGKFRANLEQIESRCRVSGITDQRLLRASHIKPWRSCANNHERLDGHNGLLLAPRRHEPTTGGHRADQPAFSLSGQCRHPHRHNTASACRIASGSSRCSGDSTPGQ
jgi:hypothetical protein